MTGDRMNTVNRQRIPGYCALCISRCGCVSVVENGVLVKVEPNPDHPTGKNLCIKGKSAPELVNSADRLLYPLKRTRPKGDADPGWKRISWDEALDFTAGKMRQAAEQWGPESVAFTVTTPSGTPVADGLPWISRLINAFGSPNTVWTTHLCNWHKDYATAFTHGADSGMPDFENTGCLLLWGFNPAACWLTQAKEIAAAKKRGAKIIVIDPRRAGLANKASQWLRVRPGTDGALALAIAGVMIARRWFDRHFIASWSNGPFLVRDDNDRFLTRADIGAGGSGASFIVWDKAISQPVAVDTQSTSRAAWPRQPALFGEFEIAPRHGPVKCRPAFERYASLCSRYPPEQAQRITGIPSRQIMDTARMLHEYAPVSCYAWSGIAQSTNATQTSRAITLLYALTGCLDAPGGNVYFAKPRLNNVTGAELLSAGQRAKTLGIHERPLGPARNGWVTVRELYRAILKQNPYPVKGLLGFGSNLLSSRPDPETGIEALKSLDFYIHADLFMTPTAHYADVVLPVASPWEREGVCGGFQINRKAASLLQLRAQVIAPRGESRSDTWITFELARRLGLGKHFFDGDVEAGLRHMLRPSGLSPETLRAHPEGICLPLTTDYRKYESKGFVTPSRCVEIYSAQLLDIGQSPLPEFVEPVVSPVSQSDPHEYFPLILTCAKWVQFCISQHRNIPQLREKMPEPLIEIHPETAIGRGIAEEDWIIVKSLAGNMRARARFNQTLDRSVVCSQFGWWQECRESGLAGYPVTGESASNYGSLVSLEDCDPISGSFPLRCCACEVEKSDP